MYDDDDESRSEYRSAMAESGFEEMDPEEGLDDAIEELLNDLERVPEKLGVAFDYLTQGYDLADAAYYAGYGNNTEGLHKVLKQDTGAGAKDKLQTFKQAHGSGKERADAKRTERAAS